MLVNWSPWSELSRLEKDLNSLFDGRDKRLAPLAQNGDARKPPAWTPPVDVHEDANRIVLTTDLPGVEQKDVEISVENNVLTLRGQRKAEPRPDGETYRRFERAFGVFSRAFTVPATVDTEKVSAEMKNGVLTLTLPKKAEAQPRQIKIQVG
jgi:HSP20 family protein